MQQTSLAIEKKEPQSVTITPMELIQMAVQGGAGIEQLERLLDLQLKWEASEARKAFVAAMSAFKANPPEINKNKHVSYGEGSKNIQYDHATLDHVTNVVTKALSDHGLAHRWDVQQAEGKIRVTCVITHSHGHSESTALEAMADNSGGKNAIQSIGSAVTYLQRYTLLAATGLAAKNGGDDDGLGACKLSNIDERLEWISNSSDQDELTRMYKTAMKDALSIQDYASMRLLDAAKEAKLKSWQ